MTNAYNNNQNHKDNNNKVGNHNKYIHNPAPEHQADNAVSSREALDSIRQHLDYTEDNYIQKFNEATEDMESVAEYVEYVSTDRYMRSHFKSKNDPRFEETYFNKQMGKMGDIMLRDYYTDGDYADYTLLSDYAVKQDEYRNVAIEYDAEEESVQNGLAIHVDLLDSLGNEQNLELSERVRRNQRYAEVRANVDKYPDLKQMYDTWEQMGYNYGLHSAYTSEEKEIIRDYWLKQFNEDYENPHSPEYRLHLINKQRNELGYDMHIALESMRNPIHSTPTHSASVTNDKNDVVDLLDDTFDLTNVDHVIALLDIQKESKKARVIGMDTVQHVNNWYPILSMLEGKYKASSDQGGMSTVIYDLLTAVKCSDLEGYQIEIVNLIRQQDGYVRTLSHEWVDKLLSNPYKMMLEYVNEKYEMDMDMRQLKREIKKIARVIVDVLKGLKAGHESKECTKCGINKMPSAFSGRRIECRKCYGKEDKLVG